MHKFKPSLIGPSLLLGTALLFALALRSGARQTTQSKKPADATSHGLQFSGEKHLAEYSPAYLRRRKRRSLFLRRRQISDLPASGTIFRSPHAQPGRTQHSLRPDFHDARPALRLEWLQPATPKMLSNGQGRTTCSYFFPSGDRMLYSSTFAANPACPPPADYSLGYVWPIYNTYSIYTAKPDGSDHPSALARRMAITPNPPSRATASTSSSPPRATATSMSSPWTPTAQT